MNEILDLFTRHGATVVFVVAFLEQIGVPVPAIPVMIVAGALAVNNDASVVRLLFLAVAGSLIADTTWFFLGRKYGNNVLAFLCRISLSPDSCVSRTEKFFDRWGLRALMFTKFIPGFSLLANPLAGSLPNGTYWRFLFYDIIGAVLWSGAALGVGALFHNAIDRVLDALLVLGNWALILIGSIAALFILFKWLERKRFYRALRLARISVGELHQLFSSGLSVVVFDVRNPSAQKRDPKRIPGARAVMSDQMDAALENISTDEEIVLYCT